MPATSSSAHKRNMSTCHVQDGHLRSRSSNTSNITNTITRNIITTISKTKLIEYSRAESSLHKVRLSQERQETA
jgi:hypothetical protein